MKRKLLPLLLSLALAVNLLPAARAAPRGRQGNRTTATRLSRRRAAPQGGNDAATGQRRPPSPKVETGRADRASARRGIRFGATLSAARHHPVQSEMRPG